MINTLKNPTIYVGAALALLMASCQPKSAKPDATTPAPAATTSTSTTSPADQVKRGEYLVDFGGCNDCHSPKRMGPNGPEIIPERKLSGYPDTQPIPKFDTKMAAQGFAMFTPDLTAAYGPWGTSFAANLTPDDTGIGNWTAAQFKKALREGKYKGLDGGRMLLPPMPWVNHIKTTDEDVDAMFAYLKSLPPVKNLVPAAIPPSK